MTDKRNITRGDIELKARLMAEGAHAAYDKQPVKKHSGFQVITLDGCEMPAMVPYNKFSRLELINDDGKITISDMGKVLGTATTLKSTGVAGSDLFSISIHYRCYNHDSDQGCKYCEKIIGNQQVPAGDALFKAISHSTKAAAHAINQGWRGCLMMTGGVLPPWRRDRLINRLEAVMTELHELVDADTLSQLQITVNAYPPDDLAELDAWQKLGINSTSFDLEVMDPAFWRAICPGKAESTTHEHWISASRASAEIFGRGRGAMSAMVLGVEPLSSYLDGFEELVANGIFPTPYFFLPPSRKLGFHGFRPPSADWLIEATEKMADILFRYADTFDTNLLQDDRPGLTRVGRSFNQILVCDEITRRLQEMGRIPPGLPDLDVYQATRFTNPG